jgi:hypothetical protein
MVLVTGPCESPEQDRWVQVIKTALGLPLPGVSRRETILRRCLYPKGVFSAIWPKGFLFEDVIWTRVKS